MRRFIIYILLVAHIISSTPIYAQVIFVTQKGLIGCLEDESDLLGETCSYKVLEKFKHETFFAAAMSPDGELFLTMTGDTLFNALVKFHLKTKELEILGNYSDNNAPSLFFGLDGLLYTVGKKIESYNLTTKQFNVVGAVENTYKTGLGAFFLGEHAYVSTSGNFLIKINPEDFNQPELVFKGPREKFSLCALTINKNKIIGSSGTFTQPNGIPNEIGLYEVDTTNKVTNLLCETDQIILGLTSETKYRTNYNMYLDLDADNSAGRFINHYQSDTFCVNSIPITDRDASLMTEIGIDSIVVQIETSNLYANEKLIIDDLPTIFNLKQTDHRIVISKSNTTQPGGFLSAIKQIKYDISQAIPFQEQRIVTVTMYSGSEVSDVAKAFLNIDKTRVPYAGENRILTVCPNQAQLNPLLELGVDVDVNGQWEPTFFNQVNDVFIASNNPIGTYQYTTQTGECPADTATLTIRHHEVDSIDFISNLFQFLCSDDSLVLDVTIDNGVSYQWGQGTRSPTLIVTEPDTYEYQVVDSNDCVQGGFIIVELLEEGSAIQTSENLQFCQSESYQKNGITYHSDTLICETFNRLSGCDSTHCLQLNFDKIPETNQVTATICDGQTYNLFGESFDQTGSYTVTQQNTQKCDSIVALNLTILPPKEAVIDTLIPSGSTLQFNGFAFDEPGTYFITLDAQENGCDSLIQLNLDFTTATYDVRKEDWEITLYPNPTTSITQLHFQTTERRNVQIRVLDYTGRQLQQQQIQVAAGNTTTPIELPVLSGIYWLQVLVQQQQGQYFRVVKL